MNEHYMVFILVGLLIGILISRMVSKCSGNEEIVHCHDCKHYDPHSTDGGVCFLPDGDGDFARWEVEPDGFCAWGERN